MNVRIVVADERQANFFDASKPTAPLVGRGSLQNAKSGLKDRDMETDRPGRRYGGSQGVSHAGSQMGHHHGVDGERSTEQHELSVFAKEVAHRIEEGCNNNEFDKLVIVAAPKMLGLLRQALPSQAEPMLAGEISKDLMHQGPDAILRAVPREVFLQLQA